MIFLFLAFAGFTGFAIGRYADRKWGHLTKISIFPVPHHWIYGVLLIAAGIAIILRYSIWGAGVLSFGVGHFISDLNDFLHLRFFGKEPPHKWKFWSID